MQKDTLKVLFVADVVGKPGCDILEELLPILIDKHKVDFVAVNGENANNGKGITDKQAERFFKLGADVITGGNHTWENWKLRDLLKKYDRILRPANYPEGNMGSGVKTIPVTDEISVTIINLQGRTFMNPIDCPFRAADKILADLEEQSNVIIVDFHAEATAEKIALGWYLDGRVSAVLGTHTHVQTADERVLPQGTGYISDLGMTGPHDSVIGMDVNIALHRFIKQTPRKFELATGNKKFNGALFDIDLTTKKCVSIERLFLPEGM